MNTQLLRRRLLGLPALLLVLALLGWARPAHASHLLGGEIAYRYLGAVGTGANPFRYQVDVFLYIDSTNANPGLRSGRASIDLGFYTRSATGLGNRILLRNVPRSSVRRATPRVPNCPGVLPASEVRLARYTVTVDLPLSFDGYYVYYTESARNNNITNLQNSGGESLTLVSQMAPPLIPNSSPTFADTAVAVVCLGDTTVIINNATDVDGDRLTYSFGTPYGGNVSTPPFTYSPPPPSVSYAPGYTATRPFGNALGNLAQLNASNGLSTYSIQTIGKFTVAVDVNEYRTINGVEFLVGTTRRDLQLVTRVCPAGSRPALSAPAIVPRSYTIEEGQALTFPIAATTSPASIPVRVRVTSALLDGTGGFNATYNNDPGTVATGQNTGTAIVQSNGTATGNFVLNSRCGDGRSTPFDIIVAATAVDCKSASTSDIFQVTINRPAPPTGITGPTVVCDPATVRTYSAAGGPTRTSYNWRIVGGTITGGQGTGSVQVQWATTAGAGQLILKGVSAFGCLTDSVVTAVDIRPLPSPVVSPAAPSVCAGAPTTLSVTPVAGVTYAWSPATGLNTTTGPTVIASPTVTTVYTLTATETLSGCTAQRSVTVTVAPVAVAPGPAVSFCSGGSAQLGTAPVAGNTYLWSPATGLSSATVANPTVTLTNTTGAPITTTYTLTVTTSAGCTGTGTVAVTVNPAAVAAPGPAVTLCAGGSAQLGTAPVAGNTYLWSPATGLSSATVANPTVTLTNTTSAPITRTYTLTVTSGTNCTATATVVVTVNPVVAISPGPAVSFCSGGSAQIGTAPVAGNTYLWTPATGLSSATTANPTVTLTNTTGAPITTTYTLTVTSSVGCVSSGTVAVTVNPAAVATAGPARAFCSGGSAQLGAAPVAGYTYLWSPATGLSSATVANPTVTLTNTTSAATTTTYTLTATNGTGCVNTATVVVTVNPLPVAQPGANRDICSGLPTALGLNNPTAGLTYSWSPATGLSSTTIHNPTATLTNTTANPVTTTYYLTVTNTAGCVGRDSVKVRVLPLPIANAGIDQTVCSGQTITLGSPAIAGNTYSWTTDPFLSSPTVAQPTYSPINTSTVSFFRDLVLNVTGPTGCVSTARVRITVNPAAVAVPGPARTICSRASAQLGGAAVTGYTYLWTPATGLSSATVANPTVTLTNTTAAATTTTYTLTATNSFGCTATATVVVTVNPGVVANAGPDVTICSGKTATLGTAPVAGYTYSWSPATGLSSATVSNPTVTLTNTTSAPITTRYILTAINSFTCIATDTVVVTVNPAAVATAGPARTFCSGGSAQLGVQALPGTSYAWTPTAGLSSATVANPTVTLTNTTTAPITTRYRLIATTASGCRDSAFVNVTVNPAPIVSAGPAVTVCDGRTVRLGTPGIAGYTYAWTPATGLSSTSVAQPVFTAVNAGTAPVIIKFYLTASTSAAAGGCSKRDSVLVTVNPRPARPTGINGPVSVCPTVTGIAYAVANPAALPYQWIVSGGTIASGQGTTAITVNWGAANANGSVKVYLLNAQGCSSDTTTLPVRINTILITPTPTGPSPVCQADGPYTYSAFAVNGSSYSWQIIGGTQVSSVANTVTVNWNPVTVPTQGKIVVTETSNPAGGRCLGTSDTLRVTINPSPRTNLALTGPARACQAAGTVAVTLPGGFANSTYAFQVNGAPVATTTNGITVSTSTPGTFVVTARETTAQGCAGPLYTKTITIDAVPAPRTISGSLFFCGANTPNQFSVPNATAGATFQWTVVGGAILSGQGTPQVSVQFTPGAASYGVTVTETSQFGCPGLPVSVVVKADNPTINLTVASVTTGSNNGVVLTLTSPNSANTPNAVQILRRVAGTGSFAVVGTVPASATTYTDNNGVDAALNSYEYQLNLTNGCGTLLSSTQAQTVRLQATAQPGTGGRDQGSTNLTWNAYVGFVVQSYQVFRNSDTGAPELLATVPATTLQYKATNGAGDASGAGFRQSFRVVAVGQGNLLANSNTASVTFENRTATYNIITPNGDGLNDVFVIDNIKLYPGNTFEVYNRWGRQMYQTSDYQNNWGMDPNIAPGVYYYLLTMPGGATTKGWVEVVK